MTRSRGPEAAHLPSAHRRRTRCPPLDARLVPRSPRRPRPSAGEARAGESARSARTGARAPAGLQGGHVRPEPAFAYAAKSQPSPPPAPRFADLARAMYLRPYAMEQRSGGHGAARGTTHTAIWATGTAAQRVASAHSRRGVARSTISCCPARPRGRMRGAGGSAHTVRYDLEHAGAVGREKPRVWLSAGPTGASVFD